MPFQNNFEDGIDPNDAFRYTLNFQPVVPVSLNARWNLVSRTILPFISQGGIAPGVDGETGLGDVLQSVFFSPTSVEPFIWGLGPVLLIPTATDDLLGGKKWGIGPTGVALKQQGPWTFGALANHLWSFAGNDRRADVNATFMQPFLSYTWPNGFAATVNSESTYDWTAGE